MIESAFHRTFCKVVPLVTANSHGMLAENMSGGSCVPTPDAVTSAQPLLHVSPASRDPFHGEPASRGSTSAPYLLSSHLRPGIAASRGPASGVVSHGPAARPAVLLPVPLRHVALFYVHRCPSPTQQCAVHQNAFARLCLSTVITSCKYRSRYT